MYFLKLKFNYPSLGGRISNCKNNFRTQWKLNLSYFPLHKSQFYLALTILFFVTNLNLSARITTDFFNKNILNQQYSKNPETYQAETFEEGLFIQVSANTLTCNRQSITLTAFSERPDLQINWSGFAPNLNPVTVSEPGIYKVTAIDTQSGLYKTNSIEIFQNIKVPQGVTASNTGQITCDKASVELIGSSTTPDVSYEWTGPYGYRASTSTAQTEEAGTYNFKVTVNSSGCSTSISTKVNSDYSEPEGLNAESPGILNCDVYKVDLIGGTITPASQIRSYEWTGPFGYRASTPIAQTEYAGIYHFKVIMNSSGCSAEISTRVNSDYSEPLCSIIEPTSSPVEFNNDTLRAELYSGVSYSWSVDNTDWEIVSGQNSRELVYKAGSAGSTARFSLEVVNDNTACYSSCYEDLTAETSKNAENFAQMDIENDIQINAYPNPFEDYAWMEYTTKEDDYVTVSIHNVNGQFVKTVFESDVEGQKQYKVAIDGTNMQPGTYYYTVQTRNRVYTKSIFLVR